MDRGINEMRRVYRSINGIEELRHLSTEQRRQQYQNFCNVDLISNALGIVSFFGIFLIVGIVAWVSCYIPQGWLQFAWYVIGTSVA
jgi:hypothetical protein